MDRFSLVWWKLSWDVATGSSSWKEMWRGGEVVERRAVCNVGGGVLVFGVEEGELEHVDDRVFLLYTRL